MEDIMALIVILVFLGFGGSIITLVSSVFKKVINQLRGDSRPTPQNRYRPEPIHRQVRSSGGEQQLAQTMKNALMNAANRGESWAKAIVENTASAFTPQMQGQHVPLAPSGEGVYQEEGSHEHDQRQADSCRAVAPVATPAADEEMIAVHRAVRKAGSVAEQRAARRQLTLTAESLQQGIIWSEVLNKRGGRRRAQ